MPERKLEPNDILWDDLYEEGPRGGDRPKEAHPVICERFMRCGPIYEYKGFAIKYFVEEREVEMTALAGDCSVKVHGHIVKFDVGPDQKPRKVGLVMEVAKPLLDYAKNADESEKHRIKAEMIAVVERLHTKYNMVHGDIKPQNFLICKDNKIRLCDFEGSRPESESAETWEGLEELGLNRAYTENYMNGKRNQFVPPTREDDWYALAISIWEIYSGKMPFEDMNGVSEDKMTLHHQSGQTVDLTEVKDIETREWIRGILRKGGASV
ncbi:hypothetical protein TWF481_010521 [Arthrobotrys musiformis]|uniref:non-specific serine/threonine protein kinase n=1 Tax=Arthrobotrys musiformis TaxID=47236 RepID=A0AAV9W3U0_9PEZI